MPFLAIAAVLSTVHLEGDAVPGNGDYIDVPFTVPAGTVEMEIAKTYTTGANILDFGVWAPEGFRGWSGGLLDDIVIGVDQSSRGYLPGAITAGTGWVLEIGKAQLITNGTHYAIDITFRDAETLPVLPKAAWTPVVMSADRRWYKGDFHVHSTESGDASGTLQEDVDLAHSRGLDFINLSDHNTISQHALIAAQQPSWPVLVMRSSEITTYSGHGNGVGISQYVDHRLGHDGRTIKDVIDDVVAQGGVFIVNHPAENLGTNCIGCAWQHMDDTPWDEVSGIEVLTSGYELGVGAFTPPIIKMWDQLEDEGHRISAVTGSDDHRAGMNEGLGGSPIGSPCTLVLADELSEAAIMDAVKHQHTMANLRGPDDPPLDVTMKTADGGTANIGDDVPGLAHVEMTMHVQQASGMFLQVWRDGKNVEQTAVTSDDFTHVYRDTPGEADHRYRVQLIDSGNLPVVITSHFYVHGVLAPGGCSAGGSSGGAALLLLGTVVIGSSKRRRRRAARR